MRSNRFICRTILAVIAMIPFLTSIHSEASSTTVWQIGVFNESSHEFRQQSVDYYSPAQVPPFIVGKSDPAHDWYAFQPGTSNGEAGHRAFPFTIQFDLPAQPSGLYTLTLALLHYTPRLPYVSVSVNGHVGWFYQHPNLSYSRGDVADLKVPHYSTAEITFDIPTADLLKGTNKVVLTAVDNPNDRDDSENGVAMAQGDSGIIYDALALKHDDSRRYAPRQISVNAVPTIFYKMQDGTLQEAVDLYIRYGVMPRKASVSLAMSGRPVAKASEQIAADRDFGEQRVEVFIPDVSATAKAELTIKAGRSSYHVTRDLIPAKKWNVYVVPQEHLDVGYTDNPAKVAAVQSRVIDEAMDAIDQHPEFRWTIDGYWPVQQFLDSRAPQQRNRFLKLVQEGKIFVPAEYAPIFTGTPSVESMIRSFYPSYQFHQKHGGAFDHAIITDVPSQTWSYASVLAAAGIKYYLAASNSGQGPMVVLGHLNERSPYWWEGPDGKKILVWVSRDYQQARRLFGMPPQLASVHDSLPIFLQAYSRPDYRSDGVIVFGTQPENTDLHVQQAEFVSAWDKEYVYPKLHFSGVSEAMKYIGDQFGDNIPTIRGSGGSYWEVAAASHPLFAALERENERRALTAEKFSTIASLVNSRVRPDEKALRALWKNIIMFDEHTWTGPMIGSTARPEKPDQDVLSKGVLAIDSERLVDDVLMRGMADIANSIHEPAPALVVFNPLSWSRSGLVEMSIGKGLGLVDLSTSRAVPYEVISREQEFEKIRFWVSDVPAVGYKSYAIRATAPEPMKRRKTEGETLENAFYRVVLDPVTGTAKSIFDKQLNREMVDQSSPYRFDQYLRVTGKHGRSDAMGIDPKVVPSPHLKICLATKGRIVSVTSTDLSSTALLESACENAPTIRTKVILFNNEKKIEFINQVPQAYSHEGHYVYFAFPFAMKDPQFRYNIQNGVVDPVKDMLPGAGLEASTVQHWVSVREGDVTAALVPVGAPIVTLGDIDRFSWPTKVGKRPATIFSLAAQVKKDVEPERNPSSSEVTSSLTFRYVFVSGRNLGDGDLSRFGWQESSPLESDIIDAHDKVDNPARPLPASSYSFLQVSRPDVVLVTWKLAQDGKGTILRFLEEGGKSGKVEVTIPMLEISSAWKCNSVEENQEPLIGRGHVLSFNVIPHEIVTVRLEGKSGDQ